MFISPRPSNLLPSGDYLNKLVKYEQAKIKKTNKKQNTKGIKKQQTELNSLLYVLYIKYDA